jgi:hypothetical protein
MRPPNTKQEKQLADNAKMMRAWRRWHREQLEEVFRGPHGPMIERLMVVLKELSLQSAPVLLAYIRGVDWGTVDANHRAARDQRRHRRHARAPRHGSF